MLEIVGLEKAFGGIKAVSRVDLSIPEGEFFSLLGPSGCGKTTLLRMLGGFEAPTSGEIRQDGQRIDALPPNQRHFNMVFQRYALFPHLNVRENVAFGLKVKKFPRAEIDSRVREILGLVKLEGMDSRPVSTLSGGQQQRVALARALVNRPKVLLLDEPLSALDLKLRQQMQVELKALQRRLGHTFIFVTHDQEEALTLSDRIAVMHNGKIEQVGTPEEIYDHPQTPFVAKFIGSINEFKGKLAQIGDGQAKVAVNRGELAISANRKGARALPPLSPLSSVSVLIRPERIQLERIQIDRAPGPPSTETLPNSLRGKIKEILYQGPMTQFLVDCPDFTESPVSVTLSTGAQSRIFEVGDPVILRLDPEDLHLLAPDGASQAL